MVASVHLSMQCCSVNTNNVNQLGLALGLGLKMQKIFQALAVQAIM